MRFSDFGKPRDAVIGLERRGPPPRYPALSVIEGYWEALRGARPMPDRDEIDPRGLGAALPYAFMLERIAAGQARIRVAGMHLNDLMGMEVRGMPFTALFLPEARGPLADILADVFERPAVAVLGLAAERGLGRPALPARLWLAPLRARDGTASRVLGGLQSSGRLGRAPRRFAIEEIYLRDPLPAAVPPAHSAEPAGFAEGPAPFAPHPAPRPGGGRPALYLVKSG